MNNREEDTDTDPDGRDGVLRHLKGQFQSYSRLGDRRSDGSHITNGQSDKWLKQVKGDTLNSRAAVGAFYVIVKTI